MTKSEIKKGLKEFFFNTPTKKWPAIGRMVDRAMGYGFATLVWGSGVWTGQIGVVVILTIALLGFALAVYFKAK